jgi:hypothetical protein
VRSPLLTALVVLAVIEALISTVGNLPVLHYALTHKSLPSILGLFRALSGPFEALGIEGLTVAGLVFVAISAVKFLSAFWLWNGRLDGAVLQLILLGVSAIFWYGFTVPYGLLFGIPQFILIALVWRDLIG